MQQETVQESQSKEIRLDLEQQNALAALGRRFAAGTDRFGRAREGNEASVVAVTSLGRGRARVKVRDAVGILSVPRLQIVVEPKIPQRHLLYVVERANVLPRLAEDRVELRESQSLTDLICRWFVAELERLLRLGLTRGYRELRGETGSIRGRIVPLPTARLFYQGRLRVFAERDEFVFDTPLNRLLLAAGKVVTASELLPLDLRRRASLEVRKMDDVGPLRRADLDVRTDRSTAHYRDAALLARQVLMASGRGLGHGADVGRAFLFRTAQPVESGLRAIVKEALSPGIAVDKRSFSLGAAGVRAHPDLVFPDLRVLADVKYKLIGDRWHRPDLYEVIAFATAAGFRHAAILGFRSRDVVPLPPIVAGQVQVRELTWPAWEDLDPADATAVLLRQVQDWLRAAQESDGISSPTVMGTAGFEPAAPSRTRTERTRPASCSSDLLHGQAP